MDMALTQQEKVAVGILGGVVAAGAVYLLVLKPTANADQVPQGAPGSTYGGAPSQDFNSVGYLQNLVGTPVYPSGSSAAAQAAQTDTTTPIIIIPEKGGYTVQKTPNVDTITAPHYTSVSMASLDGVTYTVTAQNGKKVYHMGPPYDINVPSVYDMAVNIAHGQWLTVGDQAYYYTGFYNSDGVFIYRVNGSEPEIIPPIGSDESSVWTIYNPNTNLYYRGPTYELAQVAAGGEYVNNTFVKMGVATTFPAFME
jgi:hypothetical protein